MRSCRLDLDLLAHRGVRAIVTACEAVLSCVGGRVSEGLHMAARIFNDTALPKWQHTKYGADPRHDDASSTWSPEQLVRMDSDFCTRVEIAFRAGVESVSAAVATYDLPARRRAT
jgi:hypothetical protein